MSDIDVDLLRKDECQPLTSGQMTDIKSQFHPSNTANVTFALPTGSIITTMGKTAPDGYLVCDGTVYNIEDYQDLANYFTAQFESANYFGGDGETTFAVPDLRGEFLRGSGTNSHTNQGNGANVGVHQDGTKILKHVSDQGTAFVGNYTLYSDFDFEKESTGRSSLSGTYQSGGAMVTFTTRPTNTSVLYSIKY